MSDPESSPADKVKPAPLRLLGLHVSLERLTSSTVVLMSVLVVYDEWAELTTFLGMAAVIVSPIIAIGIAHGFSDSLQAMSAAGRPLNRAEWGALLRSQFQILWPAVPPLLVVLLGWLSPLDASRTIGVLLWTGMGTLVALTAIAARRAGLRGWRLVTAACVGGVIGVVVVSLQIVLKPH